MVQLLHGTDKFRRNTNENDKFSVDSMYKVMVHPDVLVDDDKITWRRKISLFFLKHWVISL